MLKAFAEVTLQLSHREANTSWIIPCIEILKRIYENWEIEHLKDNVSLYDFVKDAKELTLHGLKLRTMDYLKNNDNYMATLLNAKFKMSFFSSKEKEDLHIRICKELKPLVENTFKNNFERSGKSMKGDGSSTNIFVDSLTLFTKSNLNETEELDNYLTEPILGH
jgi:hypothetical protein